MSQVKAYRCDNCGVIYEDMEIQGINPTEDMFDRLKSYPIVSNNDKTNVHHCMDCYREKVVIPASKINRKKDEEGYKRELTSLYYALKAKTVSNARIKFKFEKKKPVAKSEE